MDQTPGRETQPGSPGSVSRDRRLLSLLWLSPVKDDISYRYCQRSSLERGEQRMSGAARLLFSPRSQPRLEGCFEMFWLLCMLSAPHF